MKDKVVIVTGAIKGMGFGTAKTLLKKDAKVVLVYRSDDARALQVKEELKSYSANMVLLKADITKAVDREKIVDETLKKFHRIDVLVNNAGVAATQIFLKIEEEEYDKILDVNLKAPIFLAQAVAKQMIAEGKGGVIVNFSSISGHRGTGGISYDASKAGVIRATQTMAAALAEYNIRVNSISPGYHKTEMNRYHWENKTEMHKDAVEQIPLGRASEAEETAGTVIYLASDASSFVTGTDITVDGGYSCVWPGRDKNKL